ncbi:hypothetical protein OIU79_004949 [Salix purpurea]|uniref:Uncharacterized protein n=1 Tax=Salix purpurea TaxID=77065 RepID=A0A9Q0UBK4_SALPP|nr:hypothetical protein OIU79_004949 [Salix purpurea]
MTTVILQRSIQISPQEAHSGQLQMVDLSALSGVTGGAWRLEERRGRRLAGQGSDTDKVKNGVAERSGRSERWFWLVVVTESETIVGVRCGRGQRSFSEFGSGAVDLYVVGFGSAGH